MALWTDAHDLSLHEGTSKDNLLLQVKAKAQSAMRPFMELIKAKMTPIGYLIPKSHFPAINDFLEVFHDVLPQEGRSKEASGREYKETEVWWTNRAPIHWLSYQEFRLLILLASADDLKSRNKHQMTVEEAHKIKKCDAWPKGQFDELWADSEIVFETDGIQDLIGRYIVHRDSNISIGDMVKPTWLEETEDVSYQYIFDGSQLVDLGGSEGEYPGLPRQFKCPYIFPIDYWTDVIQFNYQVWPNFEDLSGQMEYVADPPPLPEQMEVLNEDDLTNFTVGQYAAEERRTALRFTWEKTVYYIYFMDKIKPTYEAISAAIASEETFYYSWNPTTIVCSLLKHQDNPAPPDDDDILPLVHEGIFPVPRWRKGSRCLKYNISPILEICLHRRRRLEERLL